MYQKAGFIHLIDENIIFLSSDRTIQNFFLLAQEKKPTLFKYENNALLYLDVQGANLVDIKIACYDNDPQIIEYIREFTYCGKYFVTW